MTRVALIVTLVAATAIGATPAARGSIPCRKQGIRPVAQTTHARVFAECRGRELAYYGQLGHRRRIRLDSRACCAGVRLATLAGRYVAYAQEEVVKERDTFSVRVRDLRTGRCLHYWEEGTFRPAPLYYGPTVLVLAPTGSVAWIVPYNSDTDPTLRYRVRKSDTTGEATVLDDGPEIDQNSLARSGATVYWLHGGVARSAELR